MGERENFHCASCDADFGSREEMERHRRSAHPTVSAGASRGYHCSRCGIDFASHDALRAHTRDVHDNS